MKNLYIRETATILPVDQMPRERLVKFGVQTLSDEDLIAILIGSGNKFMGVRKIAAAVLNLLDKTNTQPQPEQLLSLSGMGTAKATLILAALEFSRRRFSPRHRKILLPKDILPCVEHYADRMQECFLCASLNGAHELINVRVVSVGLVNKALVHPREVFADPLADRAAAVMIAHNHPSGNCNPSMEDRDVTEKLKDAAGVLGIGFLDHVIFVKGGAYYSFLEHREL